MRTARLPSRQVLRQVLRQEPATRGEGEGQSRGSRSCQVGLLGVDVRAAVVVAAAKWAVAELGLAGRLLSRGEPTHNSPSCPETCKRSSPPNTVQNKSIFLTLCCSLLNNTICWALYFQFLYCFLSAHSKYHISSVFSIFAPKLPLRKRLNSSTHAHAHIAAKTNYKEEGSFCSYRKLETCVSTAS